jgi:ABC-type nitrate/sulfonate/bicarbonate transport system permease component
MAISLLMPLRQPPQSATSKVLGLTCVLLVLFIWFVVTTGDIEKRLISPLVLPPPGEVFGSLKTLITERHLLASIGASLYRVICGFLLAILVGVPLGIAAGSQRWLQAFLEPMVVALRNIPIAALIPITMLWFGIDEQQKILFIFVATLPFVFSGACSAVLNVPERYVDTARTLGASTWQIVLKVLVPLSAPETFANLRALFGMAFGYIMLAEAVNAERGLGALINVSQRLSQKSEIFMILIVISVMAWLIDQILALVERYAFAYRAP